MRIPRSDSCLVETVQAPHFTEAEVAEAEANMVKRAGPVVAKLRERTSAIWELILAELNGRSGGQSSARTTVLAHHALRAHTALELQTMLAEVSAGQDRDGSDRAFRSLAGLAVVASDLLNKAYAAATEEGKAKAAKLGPVDQLMTTLGVAATGHETSGATASGLVPPVGAGDPGLGSEGPGSASPFDPPSGSAQGAHASKTATSPPNSAPKKGKR